MLVCAGACCVCVYVYALRIVSMEKILCFINTLIIIIMILTLLHNSGDPSFAVRLRVACFIPVRPGIYLSSVYHQTTSCFFFPHRLKPVYTYPMFATSRFFVYAG